jgi:hypothetical protein
MNKKEYLKDLLGLDLSTISKKEKNTILKELLDRAWKIRDFETKLFWDRVNHFSIFVGALFVSFYYIKEGRSEFRLLISFLGTITSFMWYLLNRGSKFWFENWERHIDLLEKESKTGEIYKIILGSGNNYYKSVLSSYAFSATKLTTAFSLIVSIMWFLLCIILVQKLSTSIANHNLYIVILLPIITSFILLFILYLLCNFCGNDVFNKKKFKTWEIGEVKDTKLKFSKRKI